MTLNLPLTQCNNPERKKELESKASGANQQVIYSTVTKSPPTPPPPPPPFVETVFIEKEKDELKEKANNVLSALLLRAQLKDGTGKVEKAQPIVRRSATPPLPPPPTEDEVREASLPTRMAVKEEFIPPAPTTCGKERKSPVMEDTVVFRMRKSKQNSQSANDRRSYVEKPMTEMKSLKEEKLVEEEKVGKEKCGRPTKPQSIANDLIDGKHPVCCVCDIKITR